MTPCKGATWCSAMALPGTTKCKAHTEWPVLNSFETRDAWGKRVTREDRAKKDAAAKAAESDRKLRTRR